MPVSEDAQPLAVSKEAEEDRDHTRLPVRVLAWAIDVSVAERDVTRAVQAVVRRQVPLCAELRRSVRREGPPRRVLVRQLLALAIDRSSGGEDDPRAVSAGGLEDADRPKQVHQRVKLGALDRHAHVRLGSKVKADFGPRVVEDRTGLREVRFDETCRLVDVLTSARGEVVEHDDLVTARDERAHRRRASR